MTADALWEPFLADPRTAALLTDFDGTLAPIVDDPATARPLDGVPELLDQLAGRYRVVAVLSGRPVSFLQRFLPPSVVLVGLYGLELVRDGRRDDHPSGGSWREVVDHVASTSRARGPVGMTVEPKGLSLTLHYRGAPGLEAEVRAWAEHEAHRSGLRMRAARMSYELHPPIDSDKGSAVRDLATGCRAVCYFGDDSGDVPAFHALDALAASGVATMRVAVRSSEAPAELLERADVLVDGPEGVAAQLAALQNPRQ